MNWHHASVHWHRRSSRSPNFQAAGRARPCARATLPKDAAIDAALDQLSRMVAHFSGFWVALSIDLAELGGFNYESGLTFAAYATGAPDAVARGGRYDEVGKTFGRARAATGFSMDLKSLLALSGDSEVTPRSSRAGSCGIPLCARRFARYGRRAKLLIASPGTRRRRSRSWRCDREMVLKDGCGRLHAFVSDWDNDNLKHLQ